MEEKLELFLTLLDKAAKSKNVQDLNKIEQDLHNVSKEIRNFMEANDLQVEDKVLQKIDLLKKAMENMENLNESNNKIFTEFKNFIDNRKFK